MAHLSNYTLISHDEEVRRDLSDFPFPSDLGNRMGIDCLCHANHTTDVHTLVGSCPRKVLESWDGLIHAGYLDAGTQWLQEVGGYWKLL